ncbi:hypothetical protein PFISCL1PPCAC_11984, partial [Pristionchus fissidentatus]
LPTCPFSHFFMSRLLVTSLFILFAVFAAVEGQWGRELGNSMGMMDMGMGGFGMGGGPYESPAFRRPAPAQAKSKGLNLGGMGAMYGPGMGMMGKKRGCNRAIHRGC